MNKEKAKQQAQVLRDELTKLEAIINAPESVRHGHGRVGEGEVYWRICAQGGVVELREDFVGVDANMHAFGNYFYTREAAEAWVKWHKLDIAYRRAAWAKWDKIGLSPKSADDRWYVILDGTSKNMFLSRTSWHAACVYFPTQALAKSITDQILGADAEFYFTYDHSRG